VDEYYTGLFRFGLRLTRSESDAADLAQETYRILYAKGADIREAGKVKGWLFTTLYRLFLRRRRHDIRFPAAPLESVEWDLPTIGPRHGRELDSALALASLGRLDDVFRVPLTMFYLENKSYKEVATALGVPIGTIMSRLSRGKNLLRHMLQTPLPAVSQGRHAKPGPGWRDSATTITAFITEPAEAA
jgi:RNA polymerase sigma-70 factor (ECF subfamily)